MQTNNDVWLKLLDSLPAIITACGTLITAAGVIVVGYWAYKSKAQSATNATTLQANTTTLAGVAEKVDGMSSDLVAASVDAAGARGQLQERDAERLHLSETPMPVAIVNGSKDDPIKIAVVDEDSPQK